jgi:hypothetical protein
MLFLPEGIYSERRRLAKAIEAGKVSESEALSQLLALDPHDHLSLMRVAATRRAAGDTVGAQEYYWRAVEALPSYWQSYMGLSEAVADDEPLSQGLSELGIRKLLLDADALKHKTEPLRFDIKGWKRFNKLDRPQQLELFAEALRLHRVSEPAEVTARLRPHRLVHELLENENLERETVDAIVAEGTAMVPLLVGIVRAWVQNFPPYPETAPENALALIGEIGDAEALPDVMEMANCEHDVFSSAAGWAFRRITETHPGESAAVFARIAPDLRTLERSMVLSELAHSPRLQSPGIWERLAENLDLVAANDREEFFLLLLHGMFAERRGAAVQSARTMLRRNASLFSRKMVGAFEECISALAVDPPPPLPPREPLPWTVYDICAGEADWREAGDEEDPEPKVAAPPLTVHRDARPGRNEPCWCGSGKKYKKCHLDSDERGVTTPSGGARLDTTRFT